MKNLVLMMTAVALIGAHAAEHQGGMVLIPAKGKSFELGQPDPNLFCNNFSIFETPPSTVTFTYDYWLDTTEVTQGDYSELMKATHSGYKDPDWSNFGTGANKPVYYVNWYDAVLYCNARSKRDGKGDVYKYSSIKGTPGNECKLEGLNIDLDQDGYRLPSEAEWEFACQAGTSTIFYWGDSSPDPYAWYLSNAKSAQDVAQKKPNAFGLYDMSGNVWEWCNDSNWPYTSEAKTDCVPLKDGSRKMRRGGGWFNTGSYIRSDFRAYSRPPLAWYGCGFRVCLPVK